MISFDIPLLMVVAFLLLTLAAGFYFSRQTTTFREYAVGNKQFATATLVATVLATNFGGTTLIRTVEQVHSTGLYWIIVALFANFSIWIISPLALRMAPFMQNLSMSETIGHVYGKYARVITALASIGAYIAYVAGQINVMSRAISICVVSIDLQILTIIATLILIFYSTFGGIRAVTFTDVFQFVTFAIIIPLFAWYMFQKIGKPVVEMIPALQSQEKFQFRSVCHLDSKLVAMVALILANLVSYIEPTTIQRVYMASSPIQARRVLVYSGIFAVVIMGCILLIGLFVFVGAPMLRKEEVWNYMMFKIPPFFKGCVSISLLAMAMSSADSCLNACSVMVSHDILESIRGVKKCPYAHPLWMARLTSLVVGLFAMVLAFHRKDLLDLLKLTFAFTVPIITAPFVLAIFGFRGTARTALIGMITGIIAIIVWDQWVEPTTGIDGSFLCMLANGLAMMAAHYLLPQPPGRGWVGPDDELKQIKQASTRRKARRKEVFKSFFTKENLAKLKPNTTTLVWIGLYIIVTSFITLDTIGTRHNLIYWPIFQLTIGTSFISYAAFIKKQVPDWMLAQYWLIGLTFCLPVNSIWQLWYTTNPLFTLTLSLTHLAVALWVLPLYPGLLTIALLAVIYPLCCIRRQPLWAPGDGLLPLLGTGLLIFFIIIYYKFKTSAQENQIRYLRNQQKLRKEQKLKNIAYNLNIHPSSTHSELEEDSSILERVVKDVTQSISFLDDHPLYKQDFQSIINKFSEWAMCLKKKAKSKDHILLLSIGIGIDQLINKLEVALEQEMGRVPRLLIEHKDSTVPIKIVCDAGQIIQLLVTAVLHTAKPDGLDTKFVRIQLYTTHLQYEKSAPIHNEYAPAMAFPAIALVISSSNVPLAELPNVQSYYEPNTDDKKTYNRHLAPERIDLGKKSIERVIHAHYGYLEISNQGVILLVLPWNINHIREEMIAKLPMECLVSETPITPKEQADSMMVLMEFHDYVCQVAEVEPGVIAEILLLLRRCYGFKRHPSGQLFYVHAAGIAQLVATWIFHSSKPIYAALLYDLIRYTRLPLSYIKANYDRGIFCFVENVLSVDKHQELAKSLLYVSNRFKEAINQDQLSVLYIKLAERLYDLRHAAGYSNLEEVKYMAKEALTIDVELARNYLEPEIAAALEAAAWQALEICKGNIGTR